MKLKALTKQFHKTWMAVRLVVLFLERALVKLLQTECADKVLRMELFEHGRDAAASDGLFTAGA